MTEERDLRRFIIRRFIFVLIIVGAGEFILLDIINRFLLPIIFRELFPTLTDLKIFSVGNMVLIAVILILYLLSLLFDKIVPVSSFFIALLGRLTGLDAGEFSDEPLLHLTTWQYVMLAAIIIAIVFILSLPIFFGAFAFARQVTTKFAVLEKLREQERRDEEHRKYLMISDIAHDLKTPMTTVSGYAKALSDGLVKGDEQKEYLDAIYDKTGRMNEIIQMLFNYVRLESEGFELELADTDICELTRETVSSVYQEIEDKGDELVVDIPEEKVMISADKMHMGRVITNLLVNAVTHNPEGTVIGVTVRHEYDDIRIFVADNGEIIEEELAAHLFEPFVMGDKSRSTGGGSGLGLSIARKVCEMHGFRLNLVQGQGIAKYGLDKRFKKVFVIVVAK